MKAAWARRRSFSKQRNGSHPIFPFRCAGGGRALSHGRLWRRCNERHVEHSLSQRSRRGCARVWKQPWVGHDIVSCNVSVTCIDQAATGERRCEAGPSLRQPDRIPPKRKFRAGIFSIRMRELAVEHRSRLFGRPPAITAAVHQSGLVNLAAKRTGMQAPDNPQTQPKHGFDFSAKCLYHFSRKSCLVLPLHKMLYRLPWA